MEAKDKSYAGSESSDDESDGQEDSWDGIPGTGLAGPAADGDAASELSLSPEPGPPAARTDIQPLPLEVSADASFLDDLLRSLESDEDGDGGEGAGGRRLESTLARIRMRGRGCAAGRPRSHPRLTPARNRTRPSLSRLRPPTAARCRRAYEWDAFVPLASPLVPWVNGPARVICVTPPEGDLACAHIPLCLSLPPPPEGELSPQRTHSRCCAEGLRWDESRETNPLPRLRLRTSAGLLDLGEQPYLTKWLSTELEPYVVTVTPPNGGKPQRRMPFRRTLERAGRWDVIEAVKRAGGFAAVAQTLGMRASRRPVGYWHDLDTLAEARVRPLSFSLSLSLSRQCVGRLLTHSRTRPISRHRCARFCHVIFFSARSSPSLWSTPGSSWTTQSRGSPTTITTSLGRRGGQRGLSAPPRSCRRQGLFAWCTSCVEEHRPLCGFHQI